MTSFSIGSRETTQTWPTRADTLPRTCTLSSRPGGRSNEARADFISRKPAILGHAPAHATVGLNVAMKTRFRNLRDGDRRTPGIRTVFGLSLTSCLYLSRHS